MNFLSSFHGVIDPVSLPKFDTNKNWKSCFTPGDVLLARIVYVDHGQKSCRLSMRPHVMEMRAPANLIKLGIYCISTFLVFNQYSLFLG